MADIAAAERLYFVLTSTHVIYRAALVSAIGDISQFSSERYLVL